MSMFGLAGIYPPGDVSPAGKVEARGVGGGAFFLPVFSNISAFHCETALFLFLGEEAPMLRAAGPPAGAKVTPVMAEESRLTSARPLTIGASCRQFNRRSIFTFRSRLYVPPTLGV